MPILLFKLNGVPEDEAVEVRTLLSEHGIDYYETHAGRWGISVAAIWLRDDAQLAEARRLLEDYQRERTRRAREAYEARRRDGRHETLLTRFIRHPIRFMLYLLGILAVLYFTVAPFLTWR